MAFDKLSAALGNALALIEPQDFENHELAMFVGSAIGGMPSPRAIPLLTCIDSIPELEQLNGYLLHTPAVGSRVFDHSTIAFWLLRSAKAKGVSEAIHDLEVFLAASDVPLRQVFSIEGLSLSKQCTLDETTRILPWDELTESMGKGQARLLAMNQFRSLTAALVREIVVSKLLIKAEDLLTAATFKLPDDYSDIVMCAGLFGPSAPAITSAWWEAPAWVPAEGNAISYSIERPKPRNADWPVEANEAFPRTYKCFLGLSARERARMMVPLQRLNSAMRRWSLVDSAIDSGIALESLFLSDAGDPKDRGELTFRLRLRAARYLSDNIENRRELRKDLGLIYKIRSSAVHSGVVSTKTDGRDTSDLLDEAYRIISAALRRMIELGEPDWERIELS